MRLSTRRPLRLGLSALVVLAVGILIGGHPSWLPGPLRSVFVSEADSGLLAQALDLLGRDYYRPLNRTALLNKGIAGAVASLNDPFSHYFGPSDYRNFMQETNPHLSGIGIDVDPTPTPQGLRVLDAFPGTPAAQAGLRSGQLILAVGSTSLAGRPTSFGSRLIKGPAGTKVTLTVQAGSQRRQITLTRASITVPVTSSSLATVDGRQVAVVSLTSFTDGSGAQVRSQVQSVLHRGAQAIVLDLRENGGGLLEESVNVASIFIPDGTIVSTEGRTQPRQVYVARGGAIPTSIPVVVLVDGHTASAAEIVAAALRDRARAKVVGARTYGKGVFQELQTLSNGGALDIVTGRWFEPNGANIGGPGVTRGTGLTPDIRAVLNPRATRDGPLMVARRVVAGEVK